ncbi:glycosyltransferase involved in cell wall biosynthesis [Deinobacterium chartae]|uniref:Glycosyltransferase involved in cell wall biosynthesis n=1 Tax=Deinobacterium chartae TaxID=521158 RepID=A0A841I2I2_9DEIO|nr:glycosyltransferase family 1 protein [Deinobacterium chartae]MBB6098620.1 glycosyltransferase involved in cell wall biosynthesis [Deinobacterium chartae]
MASSAPDLICVSHLRWNFVYQRPQHLMSRAARTRRVYYLEEPVFEGGHELELRRDPCGVTVCVPHLEEGTDPETARRQVARLLEDLIEREGLRDYALWIYSPMDLPIIEALEPVATVYDAMDELANFRFAPPELREREQELFRRADLVFTGGYRLWEAKRTRHPSVHPFPSSVDVPHFAQAREGLPEPADQARIPRPRLGFFGVLDERFDPELIRTVAAHRPEWQFVLIGPVVKISEDDLPKGPNLHYLGMKPYAELPAYLAHWDVALMPFARNEATEFISPTKTPEYLAAGVPVVSTDIFDVVREYGSLGLVRIATDADSFEAQIESALTSDNSDRRARADAYLSTLSWDQTWARMEALIQAAEHRQTLQHDGAADD